MLSLFVALAFAAPWPDLSITPAPEPRGQDAAVVVGIENYLLVDDVPGARDNAEDWFRWLVSGQGLSPARVQLLRDTEASKERIEASLARAVAEVGADGRLWVVFVGHGAPTPDGGDGVLVGMDAQSDPDSLYARSLRRDELLAVVSKAPGEAVVVLDTCFSGHSGGGPLLRGLQPVVPSYAFAAPEAVTVLTAGTATQFAGPLPGAGRPAFSYLLLGALTGWGDGDGDGQVTAGEAVGYAREVIAATVKGREQTPQHTGPDRVLATGGRATGPDLAEQVLSGGPPREVPSVPVAEAAVLRQVQASRRAREAAEAAERAAQKAATRAALDEAEASLREEATQAWAALASSPEREAVLGFVTTYGAARVSAGGAERAVDVPEVREARSWLEGGAVPTEPPSPWRLQHPSFAAVALWRPMNRWVRGLDDDPGSIWTPYLMVHGLPAALEGANVGHPSQAQRKAEAEALVEDAATYAAAWAGTADADRRRHLALALRGLVAEARDLYWVRTTTLTDELPVWLEDEGALAAEPRGAELLSWAVAELADRADDGEACEKWVPRLEALAAEVADGSRSVADGHGEAVKLAGRVKRCADDPGRLARLLEELPE